MRTPITLYCTLHDIQFQQTPWDHLKGKSSGCPTCKGNAISSGKVHTIETFVAKAKKRHKNKYDYSMTSYTSSITEISVGCPIHGVFRQTPANHLAGHGCIKCGVERTTQSTKLTKDKFVYNASKIHNNKYDYSSVIYVNVNQPVSILCNTHGVFSIKPDYHLYKQMGCPSCSSESYRGGTYGYWYNWTKKAPGQLYAVVCVGTRERFIKIGISKQNGMKRISQLKSNLKAGEYTVTHVITMQQFADIKHAWQLEQQLLTTLTKYKPSNKFSGHTECININQQGQLLSVIKQQLGTK